ncbi:MAG: HD domain-containing protein [Deltaproteobacteria bacterium]|nr:HD domain-containing protein [Deltaproteobacteria bacterium]
MVPNIVIAILDRLQASGHEAYVVGGAVRDICLAREPTDWDVATSAPTETVRALFRDMKYFSHNEYTVTLVHEGCQYEITTFRGEGRAGKTLKEDLGHRDFTINAMACDIHGERIIDPYGGRHDLVRKVVRAVGNPAERFLEDPLRLIRAARLAVELGFKIEPETLQQMTVMAEQLERAAPERIRDEFTKILLSRKPSCGIKILLKTSVLKSFLPELSEGYRKRQNPHHGYTIFRHIMETVDGVKPELELRLAALLHDIAKPRVRKKANNYYRFLDHDRVSADLAREIMMRLRFSRHLTEKVVKLVSLHMINYHSEWTDRAVRRFIIRAGPEHLDRLLALREADLIAHGKDSRVLEMFGELKERIIKVAGSSPPLKRRDLAVNGCTVMDTLGLKQGPEVGRILKWLMEKVIENPELNRREELVSLLKGLQIKEEIVSKE